MDGWNTFSFPFGVSADFQLLWGGYIRRLTSHELSTEAPQTLLQSNQGGVKRSAREIQAGMRSNATSFPAKWAQKPVKQ